METRQPINGSFIFFSVARLVILFAFSRMKTVLLGGRELL